MTVKALPVGKHFDPSTPAFGIRVGKHRRTWIVQRGTDRRIIRLGHYPQMTLSEARTKGLPKRAFSKSNIGRAMHITAQLKASYLSSNHVAPLPTLQTANMADKRSSSLPIVGHARDANGSLGLVF